MGECPVPEGTIGKIYRHYSLAQTSRTRKIPPAPDSTKAWDWGGIKSVSILLNCQLTVGHNMSKHTRFRREPSIQSTSTTPHLAFHSLVPPHSHLPTLLSWRRAMTDRGFLQTAPSAKRSGLTEKSSSKPTATTFGLDSERVGPLLGSLLTRAL